MHTVKELNSSIWSKDGNLIGTTTPSQSGHGSNDNEGALHIPQSFRTEALASDGLVSYPGYSLKTQKHFNIKMCNL